MCVGVAVCVCNVRAGRPSASAIHFARAYFVLTTRRKSFGKLSEARTERAGFSISIRIRTDDTRVSACVCVNVSVGRVHRMCTSTQLNGPVVARRCAVLDDVLDCENMHKSTQLLCRKMHISNVCADRC